MLENQIRDEGRCRKAGRGWEQERLRERREAGSVERQRSTAQELARDGGWVVEKKDRADG